MAPLSSKEFLDIQATMKYRFTLKLVRDMITYYKMFLIKDFLITYMKGT